MPGSKKALSVQRKRTFLIKTRVGLFLVDSSLSRTFFILGGNLSSWEGDWVRPKAQAYGRASDQRSGGPGLETSDSGEK